METLAACFLNRDAQAIEFQDCGSKFAHVTSVEVSPCKSEPCRLILNRNSTISIKFKPRENVTEGHAQVYGIIQGFLISFHLPDSTLCPHITPNGCPMKQGMEQTYNFKLPISPADARLTDTNDDIWLTIRWQLTDQNGDNIVCVDLPATIVSD
ncbi:Phosphatidylglycerol/phosphatidylinositol transfer protein [Cichlidogyrus casuarinus]|uniref:Phosphatidylglycerol/phosphatidylinositol transfer protein n=1 Tax=Cichlidogyrus casuarinus TaxID=1844966 RepID=A0ABD2PWY3_9PLAT